MARRGSGAVGFVLIGGYNVTGRLTDVNLDFEAVLEETTALSDDDQQWYPVGENRAKFTQNGFFDDAAGLTHVQLAAGFGTSKVASVAVNGNTAGLGFFGYSGVVQVNYKVLPSKASLTKANADYESSGKADRTGVIIKALATVTGATETSASVDGTAQTTDGGAGYLHVTALTLGGYTNAIIKLRDSADDATFADLHTFTAVTAIVGERAEIAGTIERYVLSTLAYTGAGTGQSITFFAGLVRY